MSSSILKSAVVLGLLVAVGGCGAHNSRTSEAVEHNLETSSGRYPIQVASSKEEITFVVAPHVFALSEDDKDKAAWFAETYKHVGHGDIWVVAPIGSANAAASIGAAAEIAKVMVERGVSPWSIKMNSYQAAETDADAPITVLYKRYHAFTRACGNWGDDVATSPTNRTSANFGCAAQSNLAALVEDPHDLMTPRQVDPTDPARRATVIDKFRSGVSSSSVRSADESGTVSDVSSGE